MLVIGISKKANPPLSLKWSHMAPFLLEFHGTRNHLVTDFDRRATLAMEHSDIMTVLSALDCRTNFSIKKITEYMLPALKEPVYLHGSGTDCQIVIRPAYEVFLADLSSLEGVKHKEGYFHNNEMTRFPKRVQKSLNGIHYGLGFKFTDEASVKRFIKRLIAINKGE